MLGEALSSMILGLAVAGAALRLLPHRFTGRSSLVLATGTVAGALGGLVARAVLGPGNLLVALVLAAAVAAALISLLFDAGPPVAHAGR
ncbi:hypothetical protein QNO07_23155 [Streptomyces sp. 549]|uniref:hypothetical protein n=1 Tax=Streptomyces sp. 549 TaxID=3049076 RepID=UPI0024C41DD9|nr:hypothetical protein [Streptomyces sp. 549]MDK1476282.1 hypothetical protein [Streptomyces sp. 549]